MYVMDISSLDPFDHAKISLRSKKKIPSKNPKHNVVIQEMEDKIDRVKVGHKLHK